MEEFNEQEYTQGMLDAIHCPSCGAIEEIDCCCSQLDEED